MNGLLSAGYLVAKNSVPALVVVFTATEVEQRIKLINDEKHGMCAPSPSVVSKSTVVSSPPQGSILVPIV